MTRNFNSGVSILSRAPSGEWVDWLDLGGFTGDGSTWAEAPDDGTEIFSATRKGIVRFHKPADGEVWLRDESLMLPAPAGRPTCVRGADGALRLVVRQPHTGWILSYTRSDAGTWQPQASLLGDIGGVGPVAVHNLANQTSHYALAAANEDGTVSTAILNLEVSVPDRRWTGAGPILAKAPSIAIDAEGRAVVGAIGLDGCLHTAVQLPDSAGYGFGSWHRHG